MFSALQPQSGPVVNSNLSNRFVFTFSNASGAILGIRMNYQDYLMAFDSGEKIDSLYLVISLLLLFISAIIVRCRGTEEI